ncbi:hypothetical protein Areg01_78700 [Actinoplanes regularis]|nr:hypothetical protein Areg01_78700 [Actinoplanes regularis]
MARKSPAQVRAAAHHRPDHTIPTLPGLTARGRATIAQLERTRLWPGAAHQALSAWSRFLHDPAHRLFDPAHGCGIVECCPDPRELRRTLHVITRALPRPDARRLRQRLAELDAQW